MWCSFDAVEMENALLISIIIIVLALRIKNETKKKEKRVVECCTDSTRNVVFLFLYESSNSKRGPLSPCPAGRGD